MEQNVAGHYDYLLKYGGLHGQNKRVTQSQPLYKKSISPKKVFEDMLKVNM